MKRAVLTALLAALVLATVRAGGPPSPPDAPADALSFFKNYFITGDYVVGGVGLRGQGVNGIATGQIAMQGVPQGADVVAAFLYWQVVAKNWAGPEAGSSAVTFRGRPLQSAEGPFGKALGAGSSACWTDDASEGIFKTYSYRADVLRLLDIDATTGKYIVNGSHDVQLPDGNDRIALGASLVVLFRDSSMPLSAIVIYDGGYTMGDDTQGMSQRLEGFYQSASPAATLTHIVGSGQASLSERLTFNGSVVALNPFQGARGDSWDNPTFSVSAPTDLTAVTTGVDHSGFSTFDCLTWNAIIYKTEVQDSDGDGLLDAWENNRASSPAPLVDPKGVPLPYLGDMGANPAVKDVFVEVGYMNADTDLAYGGVVKPAHTHLPTHEAFKHIGDAFKNAPEPIAVHFDVGPGYPAGDSTDPAKNADEYLIRGAGLARGGEAIPELSTVCQRGAEAAPWVCQFSDYPGTVGWKTGFRFLRDQVLSLTTPPGVPAPPASEIEDYCDMPGYTCTRRFDANRRQMFRYVLLAHAIGLPKSEEPCLDASNAPVPGDSSTGQCVAPLRDNPDFHVPRTNTGVGDFPGADAMITLGAFSDINGLPVGTPFMQASTMMHEFGHNAERRHGGEPFAPNCAPTYLSVMNYLYQLRGLLDDGGKPHLDFSRAAIAPAVDETSLFDGSHAVLPYRIGWYAPLQGSYLEGFGRAAGRHCDGTDRLASDPDMVRIDTRFAAQPVDWNANGALDSAYPVDLNFNGRTTKIDGTPEILAGANDWAHLALNQIGARRSPGGLFVDTNGRLALGPLSLDSGRGDLGRGDLGRGDLGRGDLGRGDLGRGDLGRGDLGRGDLGRGDLGQPPLGRGDLGRGDLGGGDLFLNDPNNPSGELDYETATGTAKAPPTEFRACVIGVNCTTQTLPIHRVRLDFKAPNEGNVATFQVYKVAGAGLTVGANWLAVGTVPFVTGQIDYTLVDPAGAANGATFTYFSVASYADGTQSDPSNLVTVTAVNDAPVAANDSYSTQQNTPVVRAAPGVLANDSDTEGPLSAVLISPPANGAVQLAADGSFTYTPNAGFSGIDSFVYGASDGSRTTAATVTITVEGSLYGFVPVQNLPPAKPINGGSSVPLRWRFTLDGVIVDSPTARPQITIRNPAGTVIYSGNPQDPGSSSFQPPSPTNGYTWQFNWQTKRLPLGTYEIFVGSLKTGQVYGAGAFGPFAVTLK